MKGPIFGIVAVVAVGIGVNTYAYQSVSDDDAKAAAAKAGLSQVQVVDRPLFAQYGGCTEQDKAAVDVRGVNANGMTVDATVCVGWWFKKTTVRY
jgi:hypothetical protein